MSTAEPRRVGVAGRGLMVAMSSYLAMAMAGSAGAGISVETQVPKLRKLKRPHVRHQGAKERARRLRQKANRGG